MYLKLAFRNAKRSAMNYLLYSFTVTILISIMCVSNCIAALGHKEAGFQIASLPLLIVLIMVILVDYIHTYMLKQRSKELATYLFLGMEQGKLFLLFLVECMVIGMACFIVGVLLGIGIFYLCFMPALQVTFIPMKVITKGVFQTLVYFCVVESIVFFRMKYKLCKSQINGLMSEKQRNQSIVKNNKSIWGIAFVICLVCSCIL